MDNAYDVLKSAVESGNTAKRSIVTETLRPEIVKATIITPDLVTRARISRTNDFDPRILYQSAVRHGDINAVNVIIGSLSSNMIILRSTLIKVAIEEVGIANVGLVELVLKNSFSERSTFDQLLVLSHALARSEKSDFLKALWIVYGVPENYNIASNYGLTITQRGNTHSDTVCEEAIKTLKEYDPMVVYWISQSDDLCFQMVTDYVFEHVAFIDQDLVEILEHLYKREKNILYLLYLIAVTITQIKSTKMPVLPSLSKDQLVKIEAIKNRVTSRQPTIDVTASQSYRSDIPMSELAELIFEISNQPGIKKVFK